MKKKLLLLGATYVLLALPAFAQTKHYSRLEINKKEIFEVGPDNIVTADTLIMHDKSTIKFSPDAKGILRAKVAFIGDKCHIISRGEDGIDYTLKQIGTPGEDGGHLEVDLHFEKLGTLTIDTRGGKGGDGIKGKNGVKGKPDKYQEKKVVVAGKTIITMELIPGKDGTDGTNATTGFHGGNGGNIDFTYSTNNFIPIFNNSKGRNSITLLSTIGDAGRDGVPGKGGVNSVDGTLVHLHKSESTDGTIKLINANLTSVRE